MQGSLFPVFAASDAIYTNMVDFMKNVKPVSNLDTGKAIFWSFIAGYSAKFAPRLLHRATDDVEPPPASKKNDKGVG